MCVCVCVCARLPDREDSDVGTLKMTVPGLGSSILVLILKYNKYRYTHVLVFT